MERRDRSGPGTRTYWADVSDLDLEMWQDDIAMPEVNDGVHVYTHDLLTVDHNMYITGDILWQANYNGGLQVFRISDEGLADGDMERIGFFDVDPGLDIGAYGGAWNVFTEFGQDKIIVSTLDEGLYVLQTDLEVAESASPDRAERAPGAERSQRARDGEHSERARRP